MTDTKTITAELQIAERYLEVHYSRHAAVANSENGCVICADIQEYIWLRRTALSVAGILTNNRPQPLPEGFMRYDRRRPYTIDRLR